MVLPEALDPRVLKAAAELSARGLAKVVLLGAPDKVAAQARKLNVDISEVRQRGPGGQTVTKCAVLGGPRGCAGAQAPGLHA